MGLFSSCWSLTIRLLITASILLVILPNLPDNLFPSFPLDPVSYDMPKIDNFFTKVKWNSLISDKAVPILKSKIIGPEALAVKGNKIYTGLGDGRLVVIDKESLNIKTIANLADPNAIGCGDNIIKNTSTCGRVLGLRFGDDSKLYFVDGAKGLYSYDLEINKLSHIALGSSTPWKGIYNSLVFDPKDNDLVYISVSSNRWTLDGILWSYLEMRPDGFVLAVNIKTGSVHKILEGHIFYNGLDISPDKSSLLVSVTGEYKILKVDLDIIKESIQTDKPVTSVQVLVDGLPGAPDNIHVFANELYIAMPALRLNSTLLDNLSSLPNVRKAVGRLANLLSRLLILISEKVYSHPKLQYLSVELLSGHVLTYAMPKASGVLIVDANTGKLKRILGSVYPLIADATLDTNSGDLYLGSFKNDYLLKIKAKDLK
ncbi:adipocyte plasma membrane-associated protein [Tetranychus urticae]|uniref:Strictosidine synthase conserved region domain-containing protein n=1 Tax=Tetranychus urticae TaxID=32264 RepID=T1KQY7_TETUR|nr:adipocyte plasma membrane-associated protein [Tetranychus urticae]